MIDGHDLFDKSDMAFWVLLDLDEVELILLIYDEELLFFITV